MTQRSDGYSGISPLTFPFVRSCLHFRTRTNRNQTDRLLAAGELEPLMRGVFTIADYLTRSPLTVVELWTPRKGTRGTIALPTLRIGGHRQDAAVVKRSRRALPKEQLVDFCGLRVPRLEALVAWVALCCEPETAFVFGCWALWAISVFERDKPGPGRAKAAAAKERILAFYADTPGWWHGSARARAIVRALDPGCETVAERRLLYLLWVLGVQGLETQVEIKVRGGRRYADIATPALGIVIEFEGMAKMGETPGEFRGRLIRRDVRTTELREQEWTVAHIYWDDLDDPGMVLRKVFAAAGKPFPLHPPVGF